MEKFRIDKDQELILKNGVLNLISKENISSEIPKSLFKYYSLNENNINALEDNYFYLSNPKDFNDPLDCNQNLIIEKQKKLTDWEYAPLLNNNDNKGITSFSENGLNPLMWGHYTNSYTGFAVRFKSDEILPDISEIKSKKLLKVIYSKNPNSITSKSSIAELYQFLIKLDDWKYEKEWRLIVDKLDTQLNKHSYNSNSIEEIYIGYNMTRLTNENEIILRKQFQKLIKQKHPEIPLYSIGPDQTKLSLKKMKLKFATVEDLKERWK